MINQHATLIQGTRLGVGLTPPRHTPLESSRHLTMKSMAKRDLRPVSFLTNQKIAKLALFNSPGGKLVAPWGDSSPGKLSKLHGDGIGGR